MASLFGHGMLAFTIGKVASKKVSKSLIFLAVLSAIIPDADVLGFILGVPYESPWGHRGFTHSIVFAIIWTMFLTLAFGKKQKPIYAIVILLSTLSHGVLDALTTGGKGVGFFIPFNNHRYFFSWKVIQVSPIGVERFFSEWGAKVIMSELLYIFVPCFIVLMFNWLKNKQA
ncbi:metal-dependent hydrolase [Mangrovimonas xylaniphaga]|uniref:metal-dependent hydrolase n=1 Tax=Mangrovimonas xylaniphaga TaxID=1645915 RepID=UPI0006B5A1E3|nr:metal-dependent hydrolase [Mangrovimonas xylaniphaga]